MKRLLLSIALLLASASALQAQVAFDAATESHTGVTGSVSEASFTFSHNPVASPQGVLVGIANMTSATDDVTTVTYDGTSLTEVSGCNASDTMTEPAYVQFWFLGQSVPTTDPANVVVTRTNNTDELYAVSWTFTTGDAADVTGCVTESDDQALAEENVNDGSPGANSVRVAFVFSGIANEASTPAGMSTTDDAGIDVGPAVARAGHETTAGQGSRPVGFTASSDDVAAIYIAVIEAASGGGSSIPVFRHHYSQMAAEEN